MSKIRCQLCGEPMPAGEEMFKYHGFSGPCPKPSPTMRTEVVTEYVFRDMINGDRWIDVRVNGQLYTQIGPFKIADERQRAHDDMLKMMRDSGAIDLPRHHQ